jgi:hypothetical protein
MSGFFQKNLLSFLICKNKMSSDCGQYSGANNCRFSNAASSYMSMDDAYNEQEYPSASMALFDYCPKGKNPSQANQIPAFESQPFGTFNQPAPPAGQDQPPAPPAGQDQPPAPPAGNVNWAQ